MSLIFKCSSSTFLLQKYNLDVCASYSICIVALSIYYLAKLNIKNIYISGNEQIKDVTIIETLGIKDLNLTLKKGENIRINFSVNDRIIYQLPEKHRCRAI